VLDAAPAASLVAGLYTMTPDHKPLIGPAPGVEGLWLLTGYSGHDVMGSPSGGRLLADVMSWRFANTDNPFRPGRFDEPGYVHGEAMVL
jgi:sarcosine oxidase subunit beta